MKTLNRVPYEPVFVDVIPSDMEQGKVYISEKYNVSIHLCLCGCGQETVLPFNNPVHGWNLIKSNKGISFTPSVGNFQFACKSHYIMTNNIANFV